MSFANVNGFSATRVELYVPGFGAWYAVVDFEAAPDLSGRVTLSLGDLQLVGTIDPRHSGSFAEQRRFRIVAGAGGWGTQIPAKAYHNDAGVRALTVAQDAAREAGETIGTFAPSEERIGIDYVRQIGAASRGLERAIGAARWWVDYAGVTQVGDRSETSATNNEDYEVLEFNPREKLLTLGVDDLRKIAIGSEITERLDEAMIVRELTIEVIPDHVRVFAWCGASAPGTRLGDAFRTLVNKATNSRIFGKWRYRVQQMSGDRVELQKISDAAGLPSILPISMLPGLAGAHSALTPSAEVVVEFLEGDPTKPIVTGFIGKGGPGFTPVSTLIDATTEIKLGDGATSYVALATLVNSELSTLATKLAGATAGPNPLVLGGGPYMPGSVAAAKVKAL